MSPDPEDRTDVERHADREPREYGHSSGDRNTKKKEGEFKPLRGGEQRDAEPDAAG